MTLMTQDDLGRCDFLDVLEEAAVRQTPVTVTLRGGASFSDRVTDVRTEGGVDWVVFERHPRVAVGELSACTRASAPTGR